MEDLSLHILDVAENSRRAGARTLEIAIREDGAGDLLTIEIADDGEGMDPESVARAADPFSTTRTTRRVGLGLPLLAEASKTAGGKMTVRSSPGVGTTVTATFRLSHIDRKPLGNMAMTIATLLAGWPDVDLRYGHDRDGRSVRFRSTDVRLRLGDAPVNTPDVLNFIARYLAQEEEALSHSG